MHPVVRLSAWVQYVHQQYGKNPPDVSSLSKLNLIDQNLFPYILDESRGSSNLSNGFVLSIKGDYTDLKWLKEMLDRG
jgi:hypothetical protein